MGENFSRIENYINQALSKEEKDRFEAELKTDSDLAERYNFYKDLKQELPKEIKPLDYNKKILPEINDINFTEKKQKRGFSKGAAAGVLIIFIAVSGYLLLSNVSQNTNIANMQLIIDSMKTENVQIANIQKDTVFEKVIENKDSVEVLRDLIATKENEIVALKLDNEDKKALKEEVEKLKKELAKAKQDYYENKGNFADENYNNPIANTNVLTSLSIFTSGNKLVMRWKNDMKYKVSFSTPDKVLLHSSDDYIYERWEIPKPKDGFYMVEFRSFGKGKTTFLLEFKRNFKIWLPK